MVVALPFPERVWGEIEDCPLGPGVDSDDVLILGTGGWCESPGSGGAPAGWCESLGLQQCW